MKDPYATLGVARTASRDEVKRAYRKRAKRAHPDRPGGSHAEMTALNKAYALLEDPAKRARFDAGEDPDGPTLSKEEKARQLLVEAMEAVFNACKPTDDLALSLVRTIENAIAAQTEERRKAERRAQKAERVLRCLRRGELFRPMLEAKAEEARRTAANLGSTVELLTLALSMAREVGWEDPEAVMPTGILGGWQRVR